MVATDDLVCEAWWGDIFEINSARSLLHILPQNEREAAESIDSKERREQFIAGRVVLRSRLAELLEIAPILPEIQVEKGGKPNLVPSPIHPHLYFSIAHSDRLVACALTKAAPVGIDVEKSDRDVDWERLGRSMFSEAEMEQVRSLPPHQRLENFYRLWCAEEAFLKASGGSILNSVRDRRNSSDSNLGRTHGSSLDFSPQAGFVGSVAVEKKCCKFIIHKFALAH